MIYLFIYWFISPMPHPPPQVLSNHCVMIDWRSLRPFENCGLTPPLLKDTSHLILLLQIKSTALTKTTANAVCLYCLMINCRPFKPFNTEVWYVHYYKSFKLFAFELALHRSCIFQPLTIIMYVSILKYTWLRIGTLKTFKLAETSLIIVKYLWWIKW